MHIVLRSTMARGSRSFSREGNRILLDKILAKQSKKFAVQLLGVGNAGNHLHLRIKVDTREKYFGFIRALTGEIALKFKRIKPNNHRVVQISDATGVRQHIITKKAETSAETTSIANKKSRSFWDRRPFSSIVAQHKYVARLIDYIKINNMEGEGISRSFARLTVQRWRDGTWSEFEPSG